MEILGIALYKYLCGSVSVLFFILFMLNLHYYIQVRNRSSIPYLLLCLFSGLYAGMVFIKLDGAIPMSGITYSTLGFAFAMFGIAYYFFSILSYLNSKSFVLRLSGVAYFFVGLIAINDFILVSFFNTSLIFDLDLTSAKSLFRNTTSNNWQMSGPLSIVLPAAIFIGFIGYGYLLFLLLSQKKKEKLLILGVIFSILFSLNDGIHGMDILYYIVPLSFMGNLLESIRFTHHSQIENYKQLGLLKSELSKSEKLAQFSRIAGSIAHDIRNPLSVIQMSLDLIKTQKAEKQTGLNQMLLTKIQDQVKNVDFIVEDYLRLMRYGLDSPKKKIRIGSLFSQSRKFLKEKIEGKEINIKIEGCLYKHVFVQESEFVLALTNLLSNAMDAITDLEEKWIIVQLACVENSSTVTLSITNSGPPISNELQQNLFKKQVSTKPSGRGTGLGLIIVKQIIDSHGYSIRYCSESPHPKFEIKIKE